jgi:hypothetical protein
VVSNQLSLPLLRARRGGRPHQRRQRHFGLLSPIQHRLDNVGRQQGQAKDAADVGPIGLLDGGDFRVG